MMVQSCIQRKLLYQQVHCVLNSGRELFIQSNIKQHCRDIFIKRCQVYEKVLLIVNSGQSVVACCHTHVTQQLQVAIFKLGEKALSSSGLQTPTITFYFFPRNNPNVSLFADLTLVARTHGFKQLAGTSSLIPSRKDEHLHLPFIKHN